MLVLPYWPQVPRRRGVHAKSPERSCQPLSALQTGLQQSAFAVQDFPEPACDALDSAESAISKSLQKKKQSFAASNESAASALSAKEQRDVIRWEETLSSGRGSLVGSTAGRSRSSVGRRSARGRSASGASGSLAGSKIADDRISGDAGIFTEPLQGIPEGSQGQSAGQETWKRKDVFPQHPLGIPDFIQGKQPPRERQLITSTGAQEVGWRQDAGEEWSEYGKRWWRAKPPNELSGYALSYRCNAGKHPYEAPPFSTGRFKV
mmetsp:Transcript_58140/g.101365  ORF Transcript_58140/g.101365 Transcript_58140/m.101365 type:complete len:263 (-) Transcript_58140:94-882(-)